MFFKVTSVWLCFELVLTGGRGLDQGGEKGGLDRGRGTRPTAFRPYKVPPHSFNYYCLFKRDKYTIRFRSYLELFMRNSAPATESPAYFKRSVKH